MNLHYIILFKINKKECKKFFKTVKLKINHLISLHQKDIKKLLVCYVRMLRIKGIEWCSRNPLACKIASDSTRFSFMTYKRSRRHFRW